MEDGGAARWAEAVDLPAPVAADLATLGEIEAEFAAVDMALRRLDDGSYWTCEVCGGDIGEVVADEPLRRRHAACGSEWAVTVLTGDQVLPFAGQHGQGPANGETGVGGVDHLVDETP
jgi:hypothetical protein